MLKINGKEIENVKFNGFAAEKIVINGVTVSVSTHERTINNILNKIKQADQVIYKDT